MEKNELIEKAFLERERAAMMVESTDSTVRLAGELRMMAAAKYSPRRDLVDLAVLEIKKINASIRGWDQASIDYNVELGYFYGKILNEVARE